MPLLCSEAVISRLPGCGSGARAGGSPRCRPRGQREGMLLGGVVGFGCLFFFFFGVAFPQVTPSFSARPAPLPSARCAQPGREVPPPGPGTPARWVLGAGAQPAAGGDAAPGSPLRPRRRRALLSFAPPRVARQRPRPLTRRGPPLAPIATEGGGGHLGGGGAMSGSKARAAAGPEKKPPPGAGGALSRLRGRRGSADAAPRPPWTESELLALETVRPEHVLGLCRVTESECGPGSAGAGRGEGAPRAGTARPGSGWPRRPGRTPSPPRCTINPPSAAAEGAAQPGWRSRAGPRPRGRRRGRRERGSSGEPD